MADTESETNARIDRIWMMLTLLGVGVGVSLGAVWMIAQARKREALGFGFTDGFGNRFESYPQVEATSQYAAPTQLGLSAPRMLATTPTRALRHHSAARTITVGGDSPVQVVRALGARAWKVQVRTVTPPGAYVVFSTSNNPAEGIQLVAGDFHEMWLTPGEDLYAQAQDPATPAVISVSGGEEG